MSWLILFATGWLGSFSAMPPFFVPLDEGVDSLSVPLATDGEAELWPMELTVTIGPRENSDTPSLRSSQTVVITAGQPIRLAASMLTPQGRHVFSVTVAAQPHPDGIIELEWDLEVDHAPFVLPPGWESWKRYLLHRVDLAPPPEIGAERISVVRSDITSIRGGPHREFLEIEGRAYELRLLARRLRG